MADELAAVVMAAGIGTRMKSAIPKHLHQLLGRRMVDWVVDAANGAGVERLVVVTSPQMSDLLEGVEVAVQEEPLGTGDAVRSARSALDGFGGDVLVLNGDVPALRPETIRALVETHREAGAAATVLSFEPADAGAYGRVVRGGDGRLRRIVDPGSTWIEAGVEIEPDVVVHPYTVIRGGVRIERGAEIGPFAYVRAVSVVGDGAKIGTFVEVKNAAVGAGAKIPHLSYVGDADVGDGSNVAAGNITANFPHEPGEPKGRTKIGRNVRTGVDT